MAKNEKTKEKKNGEPAQYLQVGGDVVDSVIIQGDKNKVTIQQIKELKTASALFTIHAPVTDFTGRERDLETLKSEFSSGALILSISGEGGIGKTELARRLTRELEDRFPDAHLEINLQGTLDAPLTTDNAIRQLLEPFYPDKKLPDDFARLQSLYQQTFSSCKALLLLDNAANASQVRPLIPPAPSAVIITSRSHFSLSEKGLKEPLRLDVLSYEEARRLLLGAASKVHDRQATELDALSDLCGRLPLALRVASALLNDRPDWSLDTLIGRLKDECTRLRKLEREDDRDLNVEATIGLSYNQLGDLQKLFRYLGIFPAPFLSFSATAVWGWEIEKVDEASDILAKLVNRSLVHFLPFEGNEGGLYALHDLTRFYALERLGENAAEAAEATERHAQHFLEIASQADKEYTQGNERVLSGLRLFRFIWPQLESAYERLRPEKKDWPRPQTADRWLSNFPGHCINVMDLQLPPKNRIVYLRTALEAARLLGDRQKEANHLGNLGIAYNNIGDAQKAIEFDEQALAIFRELGDRPGEGAVLSNLGNVYVNLGDARKAIELYDQILVIHREIGDRHGEGQVLGNLGSAYYTLGDVHKAIEFHEKDLEIAREIGDRLGEGTSLGNLGAACAALGEVRKAAEFFEKQLIIVREIGDRQGEGNALANIGVAHFNLGEKEKVREPLQQALEIFEAIESPNAEKVRWQLKELDDK